VNKTFANETSLAINGSDNSASVSVAGLEGYILSLSGVTISITCTAAGTQPVNVGIQAMSDPTQPIDTDTFRDQNGGWNSVLPVPVDGTQLYHFPFGYGIAQAQPGAFIVVLSQNDTPADNVSATITYWGELIPVGG